MDIEVLRERITIIDRLEQENKISKDLIKDALENSLEYQEAAKKAKEGTTEKKRIRDQIMREESNHKAMLTIKENVEEINTLKEILSAELMEFYQKNKTDEIKTQDGPRKFKFSVRILPKGAKDESRDNFGRFTDEGEVAVSVEPTNS